MNRLIFFLMMIFCALGSGLAQIPYGINYQAVARNAKGDAMVSANLDVRFTILAGSADGTVEWQETHSVTTNKIGLFNLVIGQGEKVAGMDNFKDISWKSGAHYLKVEIKFTGGDYQQIGDPQLLLWVPYALYAETAGNSTGGTTNAVENVTLVGNALIITKNGEDSQIDLSKISNNLSISTENNVLKLLNGGTTISSGVVDTDPSNELQLLSINGDTLGIYHPGTTNSGNKVILPDLYEERDTFYIKGYPKPRKISLRNELSVSKNVLGINRGNSVPIDADTTNEIQDLKLTGDVLKITKNASATGVDLSPYKDNTDAQQLTLDENAKTLSISGGNSVDVTNLVNIPWVGFSSNNLSGQTIPGAGTETIVTWSEEFDDGNCLDNNIFIAPSNGYYNLSFTLAFVASTNIILKVYKNSMVIRTFDSFNGFITHTMLLKLANSDQVTIRAIYNGAYSTNVTSGYFSGYRVH